MSQNNCVSNTSFNSLAYLWTSNRLIIQNQQRALCSFFSLVHAGTALRILRARSCENDKLHHSKRLRKSSRQIPAAPPLHNSHTLSLYLTTSARCAQKTDSVTRATTQPANIAKTGFSTRPPEVGQNGMNKIIRKYYNTWMNECTERNLRNQAPSSSIVPSTKLLYLNSGIHTSKKRETRRGEQASGVAIKLQLLQKIEWNTTSYQEATEGNARGSESKSDAVIWGAGNVHGTTRGSRARRGRDGDMASRCLHTSTSSGTVTVITRRYGPLENLLCPWKGKGRGK